ncbi:MAG: hypothetical protein ACYC27_12910 [Armatimonadota bacterium]
MSAKHLTINRQAEIKSTLKRTGIRLPADTEMIIATDILKLPRPFTGEGWGEGICRARECPLILAFSRKRAKELFYLHSIINHID